MHPIVVSTGDKSIDCTDEPGCEFVTCDPSSLLKHRKRLHGYITPRARHKNSSAPTISPAPSESSSSSGIHSPLAPPSEMTPSLSDLDILSLYESAFIPSMDFFNPPLLFPGSPSQPPYNYECQWDDSTMSRLAEIGFFDFSTAEPDTEQLLVS